MRSIEVPLEDRVPALVPRTRHRRSRHPLGWLIGIALLVGIGACSDEHRTVEATSDPLSLDDAVIPEVVFEGESATISAWGRSSAGNFDRLEAEILAWPTSEPGRIEVRAIGSSHGEFQDTNFEGQVQLPPLRSGDYEVRLQGSNEIRTLSVFPREGWVHYRSYGDPIRPNIALHIKSDGTAIVHRAHAGRTVRTHLSEEQREAVQSWFADAAFFSLNEAYVSHPPSRVRRVDVSLHLERGRHRVTAEEDLMPAQLAELVARLDRLVDRLLASEADRDSVVAYLEVDPTDAEPGAGRRLTLTLVNVSGEPVTLHFPTAQQYDFTLLRPDRNVLPGDDDGDNDDPGTPEPLVWNWAHDRVFDQSETALTLRPGASQVFEERWRGLDNDGDRVEPGIYHLKASVLGEPRIRSVATRIIVIGRVPGRISLVGAINVDPTTALPGTARKLTLAVTNLNEVDLTSTFPTTQRFDFALIRRTGNDDHDNDPTDDNTDIRGLVWKWSEGQAFPQVEEAVTWPAGATMVFETTWNGLDRTGNQVIPGIYELRGWITGRPGASIRPVSVVVSRH